MRVLIFALATGLSLPAHAQELSLVCEGTMRGVFHNEGASAVIMDGKGNMASGSATASRYSDVPTVAQFELVDGKARLNLPQSPTCGICVGEKGWRNVKQLDLTETRIAGKITYGLFSGTEFEIDRRSGIMTSKNGFTGTCKAQDLSQRKF